MADIDLDLAQSIKALGWWQGSVISDQKLQGLPLDGSNQKFWIVASQTCNLYNPDFCKISVVELISAQSIPKLLKPFSRGDHPRTLHVEAMGDGGQTIYLEIDIQSRMWISRRDLATVGNPEFEIVDSSRDTSNWINSQWLDNFAGWIARSYTRVTLPDEFNTILRKSKIQDVLNSNLMRNEKLYGIYMNIASASEEEWTGTIGLMPAPYFLEILLVSDEDELPNQIVTDLCAALFDEKLNFKDLEASDISRADAAKKYGLTIIKAGVTGQTIAEASLLNIKSSIRYTLNDYLSLSGETDTGR